MSEVAFKEALTPEQVELFHSTMKTMHEVLAKLESCENNEWIAAFDWGLGYKVGATQFVPLDRATGYSRWHEVPTLRNGAGQYTKAVRRLDAIAAYVPQIKSSIKALNDAAAERGLVLA